MDQVDSSSDQDIPIYKGRGHTTNEKKERYAGKSGIFQRLDNNSQKGTCNGVKSVEGYIVFVTGLHEESQEDDIVDAFSDAGQVKNVHVNLDRRTGFVKGYALVEYEKLEEAKEAITSLNKSMLLGKKIYVEWTFMRSNKKKTRTQAVMHEDDDEEEEHVHKVSRQ